VELIFIFVGKPKEAYLEEGVADYLSRIRRYLRAEVRVVRAEPRRRGTDEAKALAGEGQRIAAALAGADYKICLDRVGRQLSSEGLAGHMEALAQRGVRRAAFVVGGVGGLPADLARSADLALSMGPMTFTHEMSRVILLEQVFRALTIQAGEPYHR
jgi:23S rRNA (pseudouridine1915-N3)-methyltransferase